MKTSKIIVFAMMLLSAWTAVSCSEEDNEVEEYANWRVVNETYFEHLSDSVKALLAADPSRTDWKRIKAWPKSTETEGASTDYIIVHVLNPQLSATGGTPLYTDSVSVSYRGRLLPSRSYPAGYVFDQTYTGDYDKDVSASTSFAVGDASGSSLIVGFSTALQNMRVGERWVVYIPYQLGYGTTDNGSIPAYSTLIFDMVLTGFWSPEYSEE